MIILSRYNNRLVSVIIVVVVALGAIFSYRALANKYDEYAYPISYEKQVEKYSEMYGVPQYIIYAVIRTESSFLEGEQSGKGAKGLMQLTDDTFLWLQSKNGEEIPTDKIYDPDINIKYGTYYLSLLFAEFKEWETAYAAYNAGRTRVNDWLKDPKYSSGGKLKDIPIEETRNYIKKVSSAADNYQRIYKFDK